MNFHCLHLYKKTAQEVLYILGEYLQPISPMSLCCVKLAVLKGTWYFNGLSVSGFRTQTSSSRFACFYERYMWIFCYYTDFTMRRKCVFLLHSGTRTTAETLWWVVHRLEKTKIRKYHLSSTKLMNETWSLIEDFDKGIG